MSAPKNPDPIEQEDHERLCEYLFGELDEVGRKQVEAALERSPELRAERERLEATVGLVQQALPAEELSEEVQATLRAAAAAGPMSSGRARFRYLRGGSGALAAAAAVVLLVGGLFVIRSTWMEAPQMGEVARAPEEAPHNYRIFGWEESEVGRYERAGEAPEKTIALAERELQRQAPRDDSPARRAKKEDGQDAAAPGAFSDEAAQVAEVADQLSALGYDGAVMEDPISEPSLEAGAELVRAESPSVRLYRGAGDSAPAGSALKNAPPAEPSGPTSPGPLAQADNQRGDGFFLGRGSKGNAEAKQRLRFSGRKDAGDVRARLQQLGYVESEESREAPDDAEVLADLAFDADADAYDELDALGIDYADQNEAGKAGRRLLEPEEIVAVADDLLAGTRIQSGETPADMFFRNWGVNPFVLTAQDNESTFGIDVDTSSYTLARRMLNNGIFPGVDQIRTEEFVNYFHADQPAPTDGDVFALGLELAPSLFGAAPNVDLLRVTVRGKDVDAFDRQPLALTFVVDVSGSMKDGGRLELVKEGMLMLLSQLSVTDSVAVIAFSKETRLVSPMLSAGTRGPIEDAILELTPDGGTNVEAGLSLGYEVAAAHLTPHAVNRVVLFSDGVGNIGETDQSRILEKVAGHQAQGIYLNTFGVGLGNHNETFLEQLANRGDGICQYIDSAREAERALVQGFTQAMQPIARDVKIQVVFDPARVERYRLLGYENRAIADHKFRDDAVDAGEVNAGHQVTALYELVRSSSAGGPVASVHVRYKPPFAVDRGALASRARAEAEQAVEIERSIGTEALGTSFAGASRGFRRSVLVAQFAELLRRSVHARGDSLDALLEETTKLETELRDPDVTEFLGLVKLAAPQLRIQADGQSDDLAVKLDRLSELHFEVGQLELLAEKGDAEQDAPVLEALRAEIAELEEAVRSLVQSFYQPAVDPAAVEALRELGYTDAEGEER